jgi:hypothetical protein
VRVCVYCVFRLSATSLLTAKPCRTCADVLTATPPTPRIPAFTAMLLPFEREGVNGTDGRGHPCEDGKYCCFCDNVPSCNATVGFENVSSYFGHMGFGCRLDNASDPQQLASCWVSNVVNKFGGDQYFGAWCVCAGARAHPRAFERACHHASLSACACAFSCALFGLPAERRAPPARRAVCLA